MGENISFKPFTEFDHLKKSKSLLEVFTDRASAVDLFEKKHYIPLEEYMAEAGIERQSAPRHVINFYGEAGIGKTSLLEKLKDVVKSKNSDSTLLYVKYDFRGYTTQNKASIMVELALKMQKELNFIFPLTQAASKKIHKEKGSIFIPDQTVTDKLKKTRTGSIFMAISTNLSPFKTAIKTSTQLLDCFENVFGIDIIGKIKKLFRNSELNRYIDNLNTRNAENLEKEFELYFGYDLILNMALYSQPLTIVMDTYEHYLKESKDKDLWLRNTDTGLVWKVPGIIWILSGRENLDAQSGEEKDSWSALGIDTMRLDLFSRKDTESLLDKLEIKDENIRNYFIETANGSPFFLSQLYSTYCSLSRDPDRQLNPESYGKSLEDSISRFLENETENEKEIAKILSVLSSGWDDEMINAISPHLSSFSLITYYEMMNRTSMFIKNGNGYEMQENCRKAILSSVPESFRNYIEKIVLEYKKARAVSSRSTQDIYTYSQSLIQADQVNYENFHQNVEDKILEHIFNYRLEEASSILSIFENTDTYNDKSDPDLYVAVFALRKYLNLQKTKCTSQESSIEAVAEVEKAGEDAKSVYLYVLAYEREIKEDWNGFLEAAENSYELVAKRNKHSRRTYMAEFELACAYRKTGNIEKARLFDLESFNSASVSLGENHTITLTMMLNLAHDYNNCGDSELALTYARKCYEKRKEILGRENPATLEALYTLALFYSLQENYEKARELQEECYNSCALILGENHPDTKLALINLVKNYSNLDFKSYETDKAEREYDLKLKLYGEDCIETQKALRSLAWHIYENGDISKAAELNRKCYEKLCSIAGKEDRQTILICGAWQVLYLYELNCYKDAFELGMNLLPESRKVFGDHHQNTVSILYRTADASVRIGAEEQLTLCDDYIKIVRDKEGEDSLRRVVSLIMMLRACCNKDDYERMGIFLSQILHIFAVNDSPKDTTYYIEAKIWQAIWNKVNRKYEEAYDIFMEIYPGFAYKEGLSLLSVINGLTDFSFCADELDNEQVSIDALEKCYSVCNDYLEENHLTTRNIALRIAKKYFNGNMPDKALPLAKRVWQITSSINDIDSNSLLEAANAYSACLAHKEQYNTAKEILLMSLEYAEKVVSTEESDYIIAKSNLAVCFENLGEYKDAEEIFKTLYSEDTPFNSRIAETMYNHASVLSSLGRKHEALDKFSDLYRKLKEFTPEDTKYILASLYMILSISEELKMYHKLYEAAEDYFYYCEKEFRRESTETVWALLYLCMALDYLHEKRKALPVAAECYEYCKKHLEDDDELSIKSAHYLAHIYFMCNEFDKSFEILEKNYPLAVAKTGTRSNLSMHELRLIFSIYVETERDADALKIADDVHEKNEILDGNIMFLKYLQILYFRNGLEEKDLSILDEIRQKLVGECSLSDKNTQDDYKETIQIYVHHKEFNYALQLLKIYHDYANSQEDFYEDDLFWIYRMEIACYEEISDYEKSLALALEYHEKINGNENKKEENICILTHLIIACKKTQDYLSMIKFQHQLYRLTCEVYGKKSKNALSVLHDIAQSWIIFDNIPKALELETECMETLIAEYGAKDEDSIIVTKALAEMYQKNEDYEKSSELLNRFQLMTQEGYKNVKDNQS